ncbi:hypothetical protein ACLKA6_007797 [Drosophila palustris]
MSLQANSQRISIDGAQDTNLSRPTVQYVEQQAFEQLLRTAPVDPTPTSATNRRTLRSFQPPKVSCIGLPLGKIAC